MTDTGAEMSDWLGISQEMLVEPAMIVTVKDNSNIRILGD